MAVIQAVFKHCDAAALTWHPDLLPEEKQFVYQLRSLVLPEARLWEDGDETVLDWGDPAQHLDAPALALACREGRPRSLFGRSWIYYHRADQRMIIGVDRLGLFPVLLAQQENATYVASDVLALSQLLGDATMADPLALVDLLAFGHLLGEQAGLENTRHLQAGALCTLNHMGNIHYHHAHPFHLQAEESSEEQAIECLVAAVDNLLQQDPATLLPLSGGMDSRLLLAAAQAGGRHPATCCFAPPDSADFEIAATLANVAGVEFHAAGSATRQFSALQNNIARLGGGEVPLLRGCGMLSADLVTRTRGTTLLTTTGAKAFRGAYYDNGLAGAELFGTTGLKKLSLKTALRHARESFNEYLSPMLQAWPGLRERLETRLQRRLDIYQAKAEDAVDYLDAVFLGEHVRRREVAVQQLFARDYARTHPFLDPEVMYTFAGLPLSQRLKGRFQRRAIARLSPKLAEVCWNKTMRPLSESLRWEDRYFGLASYLGMSPAGDYEPPQCDSELTGWLNSFGEQTGMLWHALRLLEMPDQDIAAGLQTLMNGPLRVHALSSLAVQNAWGDYLDKQCRALAA